MYEATDMTPEQALLGCLLQCGDAFGDITLAPQHFLSRNNRIIFETMAELIEEEAAIDMPLVTQKLTTKKQLEQIGGTAYLHWISSSVPAVQHLAHYEGAILEAYKIHATRELCFRLLDDTTIDKIDKATTFFQNLALHDQEDEVDMYPILQKLIDELEKDSRELGNIPTGLKGLDQLTGGWRKGELTIIAGRPSMGKTAFSLAVATKACLDEEVMVSFFSLEMHAEEIVKRMINAQARIDGAKWRNPKYRFHEKDFPVLSKAMNDISKMNIRLSHTRTLTPSRIEGMMRKRIKEHPTLCHIVIIDYLQIMDMPGNYERHDLKVGAITKGLKNMALHLEIPVICLSQLSRNVETRADKRPQLSDLRDSGSIEQDADNVMFLYREDYYNHEQTDNIVELSVLKQRNGAVGTCQFIFHKEYGEFTDMGR